MGIVKKAGKGKGWGIVIYGWEKAALFYVPRDEREREREPFINTPPPP